MRPLSKFPAASLRRARYLLTDIDDTLTFAGRLAGETYAAIEALDLAGVAVVPVTAAPAGWCDLIARMWPVRAVIGENGGFYFSRDRAAGTIRRVFWLSAEARAESMARLDAAACHILATLPEARPAEDQPFRQTSWALTPAAPAAAEMMAAAWRAAAARSTINSLWVLGWFGEFDKLAMTERFMHEEFGEEAAAARDSTIYVGDSLNDEPMFGFFPQSVGVSTVAAYLDRLRSPPRYVTEGPGGAGFVELARAIIAAR